MSLLNRYKSKIIEELRTLPAQQDGIEFWRKKIYYFLTLAVALFGFITLVPSLLLSLYNRLWYLVAIDSIVYGLILTLHFYRGWSFKYRVYLLMFLTYVLAIALLFTEGALQAGIVYLFCVPIISAMLLDFTSTAVGCAINVLTMGILAVLLQMGKLETTAMRDCLPDAWTVMSINFVCLNFMSCIPISVLLKGLQFSIQEEKKSRDLLWNTQLQMLHQQLQPHFLFNTLNSLRSLIVIDTQRARDMVTDLSELLRVTLSSYNGLTNSLQEEMDIVTYYLKILRIRFGEDLIFETHLDASLKGFVVPKFILQPLVENGVKYGMQTSEMPLRLEISISQEKEGIQLCVTNTGRLLECSKEKHANHGLKNVQQRLELMFPQKHRLVLEEKNGQVRVKIHLQA